MRAKTKFIKMYYKMPKNARRELIFYPSVANPISLHIAFIEIKNNTTLGNKILKNLGFEDD